MRLCVRLLVVLAALSMVADNSFAADNYPPEFTEILDQLKNPDISVSIIKKAEFWGKHRPETREAIIGELHLRLQTKLTNPHERSLAELRTLVELGDSSKELQAFICSRLPTSSTRVDPHINGEDLKYLSLLDRIPAWYRETMEHIVSYLAFPKRFKPYADFAYRMVLKKNPIKLGEWLIAANLERVMIEQAYERLELARANWEPGSPEKQKAVDQAHSDMAIVSRFDRRFAEIIQLQSFQRPLSRPSENECKASLPLRSSRFR